MFWTLVSEKKSKHCNNYNSLISYKSSQASNSELQQRISIADKLRLSEFIYIYRERELNAKQTNKHCLWEAKCTKSSKEYTGGAIEKAVWIYDTRTDCKLFLKNNNKKDLKKYIYTHK